MHKSIISAVLLTFVIFSTGCASSGSITVPGEKKQILKNITAEYYAIAEGYMDIKNYAKAAEYYKLAMREKSIYLQCYYKLARSYALAKDWQNALDCYNYLLSLDEKNTDLKMSVAYIKGMKGDTDEAISMYKALIEENPDSQTLYENYIALLLSVERAEDAEKELYFLKEKFPDSKQISTYAKAVKNLLSDASPDLEKVKTGDDKAEPGDK